MSFRLTLSFFSFLLPTHTQKSGLFAASLFWNSRHFTFSFYCRPCPEPVDLPGFPRLSLHLFPQVPFVLEFTPLHFYQLFRPLARKVKPITGREESEKLYRLSITCRKTMKTDLRALLINANTCKTLYLNHLGSGAFIGDNV